MTLLKRILAEKRAIAVPIVAALLINIAVYLLVVYPLAARAAGAQDRAAAATRALEAATRDEASARALVYSKTHAEEELTTFYGKVLPDGFSAVRRMTYARLPELARKANVTYEGRHFEDEADRSNPRVAQLKIRMILQGQYEGLRRFVYELESAPEFVIIDDMTLSQSDPDKPLTLVVNLSAYYRAAANGN